MAQKKSKIGPVMLGVIFIIAFIGAMAWSTLGNSTNRCEVCATYHGQTVCRNGAGATKEAAERVARDSACTDLTHSMTELVQCQNSVTRVTWK
jgi:hypothetical protein